MMISKYASPIRTADGNIGGPAFPFPSITREFDADPFVWTSNDGRDLRAVAGIFIRGSGTTHAGAGPTGRGIAPTGCGITQANRRTGATRCVLP